MDPMRVVTWLVVGGTAAAVAVVLPPSFRPWWAGLVVAGAGLYAEVGTGQREKKVAAWVGELTQNEAAPAPAGTGGPVVDAVRRYQETVRTRRIEQQKFQDNLLANVSHELRTPLTSISGYCEILRDELGENLPPAQQENVKTVLRNVDVLLGFVNNLLDLSRIKAGRMEMTWTPVVIGEVLESAFEMVEPQLLARGLQSEVEVPEQPITVRGSFDRLRQVFVNLLGNAVKFTQKGKVGLRARETADGMIEVDVWDTGIGIAPEDQATIFDEFRQADNSIRRRYGGSGLGLSICRKLVEMHNGEIRLSSKPGEGSCFTVRLPAGISLTR
ncbi:MAG: sensor histidine kinase [Candidatus Xenobia bacterium]